MVCPVILFIQSVDEGNVESFDMDIPMALRDQETDDRSNVLDLREATFHSHA